jgi:acetyl-CoA acetyltransferase
MTRTPNLFPTRGDWQRESAKLEDGMLKDALIDPFYDIHTTGTAENIARRFHITRAEQDELAASSQKKCEAARRAGRFDEVLHVNLGRGEVVPDFRSRRAETPAVDFGARYSTAGGIALPHRFSRRCR